MGTYPLPWMREDEYPGPRCNCGRIGRIEQFVSGPAKNREREAMGEEAAMTRYVDRLARAFAMMINIVDPDVIVVGGGMSKHDEIYTQVPPLLRKYTITPIRARLSRLARRARAACAAPRCYGRLSAFLISLRSFTNCWKAASRSSSSCNRSRAEDERRTRARAGFRRTVRAAVSL